MAGLSRKVSTGALWIAAGRLITVLLSLIGTIVLARILLPEDFGLYATANAFLAIITACLSLSMGLALIQVKDLTPDHVDTAWSLECLRGLAATAAFVAIAHPAAEFYGEPRLAQVIQALSLSILLGAPASPRLAVLSRELVFHQQFLIVVCAKMVSFSASVVVAYQYQTYWALVVGAIASQLVGTIVSYIVAPYRPRFTLVHARHLLQFSVWTSALGIINVVNVRVDQLMVASLGKQHAGYYAFGNDLAITPTREIAYPLLQALYPGFAAVSSDRERLRKAVMSAQAVLAAIVLPIGIGLSLIAGVLVDVVLGQKWEPIKPILQIMPIFYGIQSFTLVSHPLAMAVGQTRSLVRRELIFSAVRLPSVVIGIWLFGLSGAVWGRFISSFPHLFYSMNVIKVHGSVNFAEQIKACWRSLISASVMSMILIGAHYVNSEGMNAFHSAIGMFSLVVIGAAVYAGTHLVLWRVSGKPPGPETILLGWLRRSFK